MVWMSVDQARDYVGGRAHVSRKTIYGLVARGLRVARLGDTGRRMLFCDLWIDEFLQASASTDSPPKGSAS